MSGSDHIDVQIFIRVGPTNLCMFQTFKYMCCGIQKVNTFRKDRDTFINTQIDINLLSIFSNENSE